MQKITVVCVGKVKERALVGLIAEYEKRLSRYCRWQWIEVADEPTPDGAGCQEIEQILRTEAARIRKAIPEHAYSIALDIRGEGMDSPGLAERIRRITVEGGSHLVFLIGGSLGLAEDILSKADLRLSFSRLTFPHQMMRLLLAEQMYRAYRIIHHEPYHK